ncbi:hypothetical protein Taro_007479, partial [Colocasia esculenta]|nr:hypothetical protein [Colocasia esculenta]
NQEKEGIFGLPLQGKIAQLKGVFGLALAEAQVSQVEITVMKLPNRALVYGVEGGLPMLFDIDGRGTEIFPTVYTLWKVPHLLPSFELKGGEVSRFVLGGADLMFPGISISPEGLPSFLAGQPWAVKVPGNPAPIAVGTTTMSSKEAIKAGLRGKALRITHYYRDSLWQSAEGHYVPNAGFLEDVVTEDPASSSTCQTSETDEHRNISSEGQEAVETPDLPSGDGDSPEQGNENNETSEEVVTDLGSLNLSENISSEEPNDDKDQRTLSSEEVDALLDKCLLQALHTSVKEKDLPMPGSTLWF